MLHHGIASRVRMSRRVAIGSLGAVAARELTQPHPAAAQATDLAAHPLVGSWLAWTPAGIIPSTFFADGSATVAFAAGSRDPQLGLTLGGAAIGRWEADGERRGHLTAVQAYTDAQGAFAGTFQFEAHPEVSEDGQTFRDTTPQRVVIRDATNTITFDQVVPVDPPVVGARMSPNTVVFPGPPGASAPATPIPGTPTAEGQTATINGAELYYVLHGPEDGPPVLLLHGGIGNTEEFRNVVPALVDAGYRTIAFDQRGRGRSTWGDKTITYEQMATDTVAMLDELGIDKTDVVGWSDGGIVALELAMTHPERLGRVVAYGANSRPEGNYAEPQMSDQMPPFEDFIADYQRLSPAPERFEELLGVLGELYKVAPNFTDADLQSITVPVLILDGAQEEFVKPEDTKRMGTLIPGAALVIMPDTGHFAPFARPDEFNRIVLAFLAGEATATPTA